MRQDILEKLNEQIDNYTKIYHYAHHKGLISDAELIQYGTEVTQVKTHLIEVFNKASNSMDD